MQITINMLTYIFLSLTAVNPGNLDSELYRSVDEQKAILRLGLKFFTRVMLYPVVNGACSELFAGLSPEVTMQKTGSWSM